MPSDDRLAVAEHCAHKLYREVLSAVFQGASVWESFPDTDCTWLHCLWSETNQSNIDLWLEPFTPISQGPLSVRGACPPPKGGQTVHSAQTPPVVAFIVTMHNNGLTAAQCLLELFRCDQSICTAPEESYILLCSVALLDKVKTHTSTWSHAMAS